MCLNLLFLQWNHVWATFVDFWRFFSGHTARSMQTNRTVLYTLFFARVVKVLAFVASEILVRKKCYINENITFTLFIFGALGFNATVVGNCWCCYCCCCCCCYCCCWLLLLLLMLLLMMEQISKSIVPKELIVQNGKTLRRWDRWQKDRRKEKKCRSLCPSSWNLISVKSGVDALEGNVL